ncbi:MAG: hypothetical protein II825_00160 [Paludibacteraceae bacterium]|nr:hypothetical protein [Paludibacteraceae bacterium]
MRNILFGAWMVLAALVFSSCGGQSEIDDPQEEAEVRFEISVDSVETTAARIVIMPSDTVSTYYWNVFYAASIAGMSDETLRSEMEKDFIEWWKTSIASGYAIPYSRLLSKGNTSYRYTDLAANTDYVVLSVAMNDSARASGTVAKEYFTTLPMEEDSVVTIATTTAKLHDWTKINGTFMLMTTTEQGMFVSISVYSDKLEGTFTSKDMDQTASYITLKSSYDIIELEFTGKKENENYVYEGWFITVNKVKYRFRFLCSL